MATDFDNDMDRYHKVVLKVTVAGKAAETGFVRLIGRIDSFINLWICCI